MGWTSLGQDLLSFFFPDYCLGCRNLLASTERYLCPECLRRLPRYTGHESYYCSEERVQGLIPFTEIRSDLIFRTPSLTRDIIHEIKYHSHPDLALMLARRFGQEHYSLGHFCDVSLVIPVPLSPSRLRKRGFNQSEYLARGLCESLGIEMRTDCLSRSDKGSQTARSKDLRWKSLQGAFHSPPGSVRGRRVLLVDDVLTSGATLVHAADALYRQGGAESVSLYTLALDAYI